MEKTMNTTPRILYVDDDADGCEFMAARLNHFYGYQVDTALNGGKALALIQQRRYEAYLLDYCLPDVTAVNLCKQIKTIDPAAPILIYSALDRDVDRQHALEAGAKRYFVKPEQLDMIGPELKKILRTKGFGQPSVSPGNNAWYQDRKPLRRRAGGII
jgi:DNA-binding response OmpR family regulator